MKKKISINRENKIKELNDLSKIIADLKSEGKYVVHSDGVFDLLHPGHIRHLEAAKRQGNILVVTVAPDEYVKKGPGRPVFNHYLRAESLAALECVDYVAINKWPTAVEAIKILKPGIYAKGSKHAKGESDPIGKTFEEEQAILSVGGRMYFTDEITFSSSSIINNHFGIFAPETENWLKAFRKRHSPDELIRYLEKANSLKALVIGEAIIDEYVFCDGLGKSTKDPILAFQYRSTEAYAGGSLAVANHLAGFCKHVGLVTFLGETERREDFISRFLKPNVKPVFLTRKNAPTIHKRRFVDTHTNARLFEIYVIEDTPLEKGDEDALRKTLKKIINDYDLVVVTDYGHGMLVPSAREILCSASPFLAVNTQANAGNRGFNTISKYRRADYVCLAGHEVALETRMRHAGWNELLLEIFKRIKCPNFTVTKGKGGSLHYNPKTGFVDVPALAVSVKDRVGAGDAVLAVTSLLTAKAAPWDIVGFMGNLAGAEMVAELGNRISVSRESLTKHIISIMK